MSELAELDALDSQTNKQAVTNPAANIHAPAIQFPSAPSTKVEVNQGKSRVETDEEREIRELEASMLA